MNLIEGILRPVLKSNDTYLECGVLTGISCMLRFSSGSDLNNVIEYMFLDAHQYTQYYGFTAEEIDSMLEKLGLQEMREGIENWYNGYRARYKKQPTDVGKELYVFNPWSVLRYLTRGKLGNYWEESGSIQNIKEIFKAKGIREKIERLIQEEPIELTLNTKLTLDRLDELKPILTPSTSASQAGSNLFFTCIFEQGYLSRVEDKPCYYRLPNEEIKSEMVSRVLNFYISQKILSEDAIEKSIKALENTFSADDQVEKLKEALNELLRDVPLASVSDPSQSGFQPNEDFYHTIINGLAIRLIADRLLSESVSANRATPPKHKKIGFGTEVPFRVPPKQGRADIVLIKDNVGIIIELKHGSTASGALNQIQEKGYENTLKDYTHLPKIKEIGINVSKDKEVSIECKLLDNLLLYSPFN